MALAAALKETSGDLATKQSVERLSDKAEARFKLLQWMLGFNLAFEHRRSVGGHPGRNAFLTASHDRSRSILHAGMACCR